MHPYKTLQVTPDSDSETIRDAYLVALRRHPPERDPDGFRLVNDAYDLIKSEDLRLKREIGLHETKIATVDSPIGSALLFFKASQLNHEPPAEEEFYKFLQSE